MEGEQGVVEFVKSWFKPKDSAPKLTPEAPRPISGWDYETYREYLIAISKGREYLLPIEEYPSRMDLNRDWHKTFNDIRPHPYESWNLVGFQYGQRRLVLPVAAEKGLSHSVPCEVMDAGLEKARVKSGVTDLVGDIHSHPRDSADLSWRIPVEQTSEGEGSFSLGDMYGLLYSLRRQRPSDSKRSIMFVVEGNEIIAAFATRRSLELVKNNFKGSYEKFANYWYERYGWNFKGKRVTSEGGGELVERVRPDAPKIWQINKGIAHYYQLALYRGFKDRPLLREYPARVSI